MSGSERVVPFSAVCKADPLLGFIRNTYSAIPVRVPDPRWRPLSLFTLDNGAVRYLGTVAELGPKGPTPRVERVRIPEVSYEKSSDMTWQVAAGFVGPFIAASLGMTGLDLEAGVEFSRHRQTKVRLSLGRASREFISPVSLATWLESENLRLPGGLEYGDALYLVDAALYSKELTIQADGASSAELTLNLAATAFGNLDPGSVLRSDTKVQITGSRATAFAFTCLEVEVDAQSSLVGLRFPHKGPRAAATSIALTSTVPHVRLGANNELARFDV